MAKAVAFMETPSVGHAIFQRRAARAIEALLSTLDRRSLDEAASAPTDVGVLLSALQQPAALDAVMAQDPLAEARLLGQVRRKELLEAEGGVLGPEEVGNLLGIQRQSSGARRERSWLLSWEIASSIRRGRLRRTTRSITWKRCSLRSRITMHGESCRFSCMAMSG